VVGRVQAGELGGEVAADDFVPGGAVRGEVDAGGHGGEAGGEEEQGEADADFHLGEAAQAQHRGCGVAAQALGDHEVAEAEGQQHAEHGYLGADHDAVGGAVERLPTADIEQRHGDAAEQDAGDTGHGDAAEAAADVAQGAAIAVGVIGEAGEGHDEAGDAADPDGGAELVEEFHGQQQGVVVQPGAGVGGQRGGGKFHDAGGEQRQCAGIE
jgi:hypothetical protein